MLELERMAHVPGALAGALVRFQRRRGMTARELAAYLGVTLTELGNLSVYAEPQDAVGLHSLCRRYRIACDRLAQVLSEGGAPKGEERVLADLVA